ncbi:MAG: CDP-glycerol glycerophosphotransferase family protein [Asticcacaulis sp.]|nr:CDP-glycerol glycerophosphotransferase family protein [Asticcacaulis sp.]
MALERCLDQIDDEARKVLYVMQQVKPSLVLLWHQWNSLMEVGRTLANALAIPSAYLHEGMVPKTLTLDAKGMMAEASCVGVTLKATRANAPWLEKAGAVISEIRDKRLDRKPQSGLSVMGAVRARADAEGAKLVFYAGINDWHSGNLPRDGRSHLHSPVYEDTQDGLDALAALAEANNWLILFKPHPNLYPQAAHPHPRVVVVRESNVLDCLLLSDVTVTILSSVAYIALANDRPVVLMGRNTLSGSGSAYEVTAREGLADTVNAALAHTGFDAHRLAFRRHIAALLRDHLYAYDPADTLAALTHEEATNQMMRIEALYRNETDHEKKLKPAK